MSDMRLSRSQVIAVALIAARLLALGACAATPPAEPVAFTVDYETGSIPPPSNHVDRLEGRFDKDALVVDYSRTYRFRDSLTAEELAALSPDEQDVAWQGQLTGAPVEAWRSLLRQPLTSPPERLPGSDSFLATIRYADGTQRAGARADRAAWQALIDGIDREARGGTGTSFP